MHDSASNLDAHKHYTLYVDGACKGNPGKGGWGAYIIDPEHAEQEYFGGAEDTTNNRMELTAAIEGIRACPNNAKLTIYTDSNYVKRGITEWITGWKAKNWKDVKNPDLWQTLDEIVQGRDIDWHWIKGHAGHEGNERADQLANKGVDSLASSKAPATSDEAKKKVTESDWLLDDPFGLDTDDLDSSESVYAENLDSEDVFDEANASSPLDRSDEENIPQHTEQKMLEENDLNESSLDQNLDDVVESQSVSSVIHTEHAQIKITETSNPQVGERLLILDTETTGFYYQDSDRIIEVGAIEMINRKLTGSSIHIYINPEKAVGESENIHGISDDFLQDKPKFAEIAEVLFDYLKGAEIVAHNATFDMNFLDAEFDRAMQKKLSDVCRVTDTLAIAKRKHPGQKNSLDILVKRYEIPPRDRTFHGALLDAEILADVYLAMTGGQVSFSLDQRQSEQNQEVNSATTLQAVEIPLIYPHDDELQAHQDWMAKFQAKNDQGSLFTQLESALSEHIAND
ncbi:ribonuclease HI / DNA polymerase-3 subunit epsilon [Acinetobacter marinus]|uniref:Ribonuclease H n=1 Tax=Acinetobacter marinus TaxID=281375 RepID=A0A1G6GUM7_9GAMM|nr:DNA polymerase III subunit epsilon [Acinetobacter marinus]SDB85573.1 ribonuclease HI / DNA polymerase-3 subunit epsilon [Acinetobacter marinus]